MVEYGTKMNLKIYLVNLHWEHAYFSLCLLKKINVNICLSYIRGLNVWRQPLLSFDVKITEGSFCFLLNYYTQLKYHRVGLTGLKHLSSVGEVLYKKIYCFLFRQAMLYWPNICIYTIILYRYILYYFEILATVFIFILLLHFLFSHAATYIQGAIHPIR